MECENVKGKTADQGKEFFVTGLEKYLDAKSAVTMFEKEFQRRVKTVVTGHKPELAKLFGEDLDLRDYFESAMPDSMYLGQQIVFEASGALYFYFRFYRDEDGGGPCLYPVVMFWREKVTLLDGLWKEVEMIPAPKPEINNRKISLKGSVPSNDWASCEAAFNAIIRDWIELWQKLGGLPKYLPRKSN
jgi:hypothetical protein